jgi:hypothetical protein
MKAYIFATAIVINSPLLDFRYVLKPEKLADFGTMELQVVAPR